MARRPLQQAHAQPGFQLLDRIGHGRARQAGVFGGSVKLRRSTTRVNTRIASNLSIGIVRQFPDSDAE
jgi:hypothetical protein